MSQHRLPPQPIAPELGFNFAPAPFLEYLYPPPSDAILANIRNALIAVPRFYTQVLHLMNKMNMPPPFGPETATLTVAALMKAKKRRRDDLLSSDESEMSDSDEDEKKASLEKQKPAKQSSKVVPKDIQSGIMSQSSGLRLDAKQQKLVFKIGKQSAQDVQNTSTQQDHVSSETIQPGDVDVSNASNQGSDLADEQGKNIHDDIFQHQQVSVEIDPSTTRNVVSLAQLQKQRLSPEDMAQQAVFKKYSPGIPSNVLYIKNLNHKLVTEQDLHYIFGRYFTTDEETKEKLGIKLMLEGKLKGQAFVTTPSTHLATQILQQVHGYVLHDKPMVIAFGKRTSETKEDE
eukprot:TRINITY_DN6146_c0_g1_i1.p1 TRINITY_DN6146_c0_g1~~TRINITY_DN6146_c0_g1_i1.p1  ORF type:complete len:345 (+),score=97.49 TRINITY_DN6146_c0_g1_i1:115-1149(+)